MNTLEDNSGGSRNMNTLEYGSFHCAKFRNGKRCDMCKHMVEKGYVESKFYKQKFRIHGHLAHDIGVENKKRWFIYQIEDVPCQKSYIGSTTNPTARWRNHKSSCNIGPADKSGLAKHFQSKGTFYGEGPLNSRDEI